jgi:hypothetical protein
VLMLDNDMPVDEAPILNGAGYCFTVPACR